MDVEKAVRRIARLDPITRPTTHSTGRLDNILFIILSSM
jgi:hypothetical protein